MPKTLRLPTSIKRGQNKKTNKYFPLDRIVDISKYIPTDF